MRLRSNAAAARAPHLPLEIVAEILLNVPPVALITTCRRVSTTWKCLIETSPELKYYSTTGLRKRDEAQEAADTAAITPMALEVISRFWGKVARKTRQVEGDFACSDNFPDIRPLTNDQLGSEDIDLTFLDPHKSIDIDVEYINKMISQVFDQIAEQFDFIMQTVPFNLGEHYQELELGVTTELPPLRRVAREGPQGFLIPCEVPFKTQLLPRCLARLVRHETIALRAYEQGLYRKYSGYNIYYEYLLRSFRPALVVLELNFYVNDKLTRQLDLQEGLPPNPGNRYVKLVLDGVAPYGVWHLRGDENDVPEPCEGRGVPGTS
ncbi:hypothetical protein Dda_4158 [Drechslerella dactyloides]|uniref:F-box domain-containing protein n=1 Tax=Drechslerella dactyloides TaxID=74499 RepID=A0AAD6NLT2_DREDA|nr:hypothetical protein Dda_4158 [Drechslerella dactyloides]